MRSAHDGNRAMWKRQLASNLWKFSFVKMLVSAVLRHIPSLPVRVFKSFLQRSLHLLPEIPFMIYWSQSWKTCKGKSADVQRGVRAILVKSETQYQCIHSEIDFQDKEISFAQTKIHSKSNRNNINEFAPSQEDKRSPTPGISCHWQINRRHTWHRRVWIWP